MHNLDHYASNRKTCEHFFIVPLAIKYWNMISTSDVSTGNNFGIKSFPAFPLAFFQKRIML